MVGCCRTNHGTHGRRNTFSKLNVTTRATYGLLLRLVCSIALLLTALPNWASETVCVMPHREPVPMAKCGMPCCAKAKAAMPPLCAAPAAARKPSCCAGSTLGATARPKPTMAAAHVGCRCETRITGSRAATAAVTAADSLVPSIAVAILDEPLHVAVSPIVEAARSPGIVGTDSGPPPDPADQEPPGRAPPAR